MNSVFVKPEIYSCADDAFLETSTRLFLPYHVYAFGMILQTCLSLFEKTVHS